MEASRDADDDELKQLQDIYSELRSDAKQIVIDLEGGVAMWREAAAGAFASAGFIVILVPHLVPRQQR
jgi:hypothetical protein